MCQKLHELKDEDYQWYKDLDSEWGESNKCQPIDPSWISDPSEEIFLKEHWQKTLCFLFLALLCISLFVCGFFYKNKSQLRVSK
jgi:hypothetical protein